MDSILDKRKVIISPLTSSLAMPQFYAFPNFARRLVIYCAGITYSIEAVLQ